MNNIFKTFKQIRQKLLDIDLESLAKKNKSTQFIIYKINRKPRLFLIENTKYFSRNSKKKS